MLENCWALPLALFIAYVFYVHLLIEEIRRENHLGYLKPCKQWDKLPVPQLVQDFFLINRSIESKCHPFHPFHPFGFERANFLGFSILWPIDLWISWVQMFLENLIHQGFSMEKNKCFFQSQIKLQKPMHPIFCFKSMIL